MQPIFSIIIPCYNQGHFLPDNLNSLLAQAFQHWEALVINDGSKDDTSEVASRYAAMDNRIKLIEQDNGGLSSARNTGVKHAVGQRFIFLDADDFMYPNCLYEISKLINIVDDHTLIQYGYTYVKEDGKQVLGHTYAQKKENLIVDIFKGNLGPCHSICISRYLLFAAGAFDESLKSVEDWDLWMRAVKVGGIQKIIPEVLVYYRYVKNSMSRDSFVMYDALKKVINRGVVKDSRITIESKLNDSCNVDTSKALQDVLIRSLGVSVMQGKIDASLSLFRLETLKPIEYYQPTDFEPMCSYLSFRYWYAKEEIDAIINNTIPSFSLFLKKAGYSEKFILKTLFCVFHRHLHHNNNFRFGRVLGKLVNVFMRKIQYPLFIKFKN